MGDKTLRAPSRLFPGISRARFLLLAFLVYTDVGLWNLGVKVTDNLAGGHPSEFYENALNEMTAAYIALALLPLVLWFIRLYPLRRRNLTTRLPLYFLAAFAYTAVQMALMFTSRTLLYPPVGLGRFDYGQIFYRYLMESLKIQMWLWIVYGVVSLIRAEREREAERLQASRLEEQLTRARLQNLQAQLHPHFLFNTLNTISATMYKNVEAADRMIADLSDFLRSTLAGANPSEQSLEREVEMVRLYVAIMKARFGDRLSVSYDLTGGAERALVPTFLLQPLVENAIKHGQVAGRATEILVRAERTGRGLRLSIQDNGPGIRGDPQRALKAGVGLSNVAERLERIYGPDQTFSLDNRPGGGLTVAIEIPLRMEEGPAGEAGVPGRPDRNGPRPEGIG